MELTLYIEDLINEDYESLDLAIVARVITERFISPDALFSVFHRVWAKKGGNELKVPNYATFMLYFEDVEDLCWY